MSEDADAITPREVLDGRWLSCWEALEQAEETLRSHAVKTDLPAGQLIARMAATGYLPTISNDLTHTVPKDPSEPDYLSMSDEERAERRQQTAEEERRKQEGKGEWQLVPVRLWASVFGFCNVSNRHIHLAQPDFKSSSIVATFTQEELPRNAPIWQVFSDPGFYMMTARNILIYKDGLFAVDRFAEGWPDDGDKYIYNNLDLSQLQLPPVLPLAEMKKRWVSSETAGPQGSDQANGSSRGRPGGKNGEPIAALTIKLMGVDERTLASYTADAAGSELQGYYSMVGSPARSIDNCRKDAAGVLRQVRGARGLS